MAIFQPPVLPIPFIYLLGVYTMVWLYFNVFNPWGYSILKESQISRIYNLFLIFLVYILFFGTIDMALIESADTLATRLRSINQLVILPLFQFSFIWYLLIKFTRRCYTLKDILTVMILAGLLQSLFSLSALLIPQLRSLYLTFGNTELYSNLFFISRRGFGFSGNLLDTFGYGMGLLTGYMLFFRWTRSKLMLILSVILMLLAIALNARTGFVVFFIAIIVKMVTGKKLLKLFTILSFVFITFILIKAYIPIILEMGMKSENDTVSWISGSFNDIYYLLSDDDAKNLSMEEVGFLDNFIGLPENCYELLFGTGHNVYDTGSSLGFRTDIGYYNLFWEFGLIGGFIMLSYLLWFILKPFFLSTELLVKRITLLNFLSYAAVLMKAILLGYNPGVFVNYTVIFSIYYCMSNKKHKKCLTPPC